MAVKIKILNQEQDPNSDEYKATLDLQKALQDSINHSVVNGTIYIGYGFTLTGQPVRDIDIVVAGSLQNCRLPNLYDDPQYGKHDVIVDSFVMAIELKKQDDELIHVKYTHIWVDYPSTDSTKDATNQNEKQRYALMTYFFNAKRYNPYVVNALWLKSITGKKYQEIQSGNPKGVIPPLPTFNNLMKVICQQGGCKYSKDDDAFIISISTSDACPTGSRFIYDFNEEFGKEKPTAKGLTRKKMELLSQSIANKQLQNIPVGEKLTIFTGRAGTGKTINLIQTAMMLADNTTGKRCMILTYNHALVSDINRLFSFLKIPDKVDGWTIQIETSDKFFRDLMISFCLDSPQREEELYDDKYRQCISQLNDFIKDGMSAEEIHEFKNSYAIDWDYILVDEGQDWSDEEKNILFKLYGATHVVVADGVDQFVKKQKRQPWAQGIEDFSNTKKECGLRQESNLVDFVNAFASKVGLDWNVKPSDIRGGRVKIYDSRSFKSDIHKEMIDHCRENDCENYDILYLVSKDDTEYINGHHHFKYLKEFKNAGINVFDGTNEILRCQFPQDMSQCRMFLYQSCRGLEGWVTICHKLDIHFNWLLKNLPIDPSMHLGMDDPEAKRKKAAYLCLLIPLTRPISRLIITLEDTKSELAKYLKEIAEEHSDCVDWMIE